ncbi:MAG: SH3 domain-containing protein [Thiomargarita sp.]|nr:SH3 domain-containing protein [Thiomargarita sp.]
MTIHTHTIDERKHGEFLKEERHDPFIGERIKVGDEIVFCAKCKSAYLLSSWKIMADKNAKCCKDCDHTKTLKEFPQTNKKPLKFERKPTHSPSSSSITKGDKTSLQPVRSVPSRPVPHPFQPRPAPLSRRNLLFQLLISVVVVFLIVLVITWEFQKPTEPSENKPVKEEIVPYVPVRIITGAGVKLRKKPRWNSKTVDILQIGTIVRPLKDLIIQREHWYQVIPTNKKGWVPNRYTMLINFNKREQAYVKVAEKKLKGRVSFGGMVDLYNFLNRVSDEVTKVEIAAELKLLRLLALQRSLEEIPSNKQRKSRYSKWINEQRSNIVYNRTTGIWSVKKERFQRLYNEYRSLPIADRILREMP